MKRNSDKATHKRKHLIGDLITVSEDESMTSWQEVGRHGTGEVAENLRLIYKQEGRGGGIF